MPVFQVAAQRQTENQPEQSVKNRIVNVKKETVVADVTPSNFLEKIAFLYLMEQTVPVSRPCGLFL
jgi:hypothetical protein